MSKRRVIYLRNPSSGSNFRTIFGGASIGGGGTNRPPFSYPNFPIISVTVHPSYAPWLPGGQGWADLQNNSVLTQGFGNATTGNNIIQYWTTVDWTDYFHKPTKSVEPTRSPGSTGPSWTSFFSPANAQAEAQYYALAAQNGITNPPPPSWGGVGPFGNRGSESLFESIRREIWDAQNDPGYWDLDVGPQNNPNQEVGRTFWDRSPDN